MSSDSFSLAAQHLIYSTKVTLYAPWTVCNMSGISVRACPLHNPPPCLCSIPPDSRIAFAGPRIIQMSCAMDISEKLCHLETALPSVSRILSSSALTEQVVHLKNNMNVGLPDGRAALLRFRDPRVQVRLATMLNDLQHQKLTGLMQEWLTIVDGKVWSFKQREFIC